MIGKRNENGRSKALRVTIGCCAFALMAPMAHAITYYVSSTSGDDNRTTTQAQNQSTPWRTIQKAASVAVAGDYVEVLSGTYRETVTPANSGSPGAPITFEAASGATVTIDGGDLITGFTQDPAGYWKATKSWAFTSAVNQSEQVVVNGEMVDEAKWPNEPTTGTRDPFHRTTATVGSIVSYTTTGATNNQGYAIGRLVIYDPNFNEPDGRWDGGKFWLNSSSKGFDGNGQSGTIVTTSQVNHTITLEGDIGPEDPNNPTFAVRPGTAYYLFGKQGGLDSNGEWFFNPSAGQLYLRTRTGVDPNTTTVTAKRRDWAFNLSGKSYITVKGFKLLACSITTDTAAGNGQDAANDRQGTVAPANHIILDGLNAKYVSHFTDLTGNLQYQWAQSSGIILSGSDNTIQNSEVNISAGCGIVTIGQRNKVYNNIVHNTNYQVTDGGAIGAAGADHDIGYNSVFDVGVDGISIQKLTNSNSATPGVARIHHNLIYNAVALAYDSGAIHEAGNNGNGVRIDHNIIHDMTKERLAGVYLDFGPTGGTVPGNYIIDHNVIYNLQEPITINHVSNVQVYNNTAIQTNYLTTYNEDAAIGNYAYDSSNGEGVTLRNNIFNNTPAYLGNATSGTNIFTATSSLFVDAANGNFQLASSASSAINKGVSVAPYNDPRSGSKWDLGAYEYGLTAWTAGANLSSGATATTYSFADLPSSGGACDGVHGGINFGVGQWAGGLTWDGLTSSGYFLNNVSSCSFTLPAGTHLVSLKASPDNAGKTITISDGVNQNVVVTLSVGVVTTITTGWTQPGPNVTISFDDGWNFAIDDITYQ